MIDALKAAVALGTPIVGLEPSCLLTLRDEYPGLLPGDAAKALAAHAQLFEEFVDSERRKPAASTSPSHRCRARPPSSTVIATKRRSGQPAPRPMR